MKENFQYISGVCNINQKERKKRLYVGLFLLVTLLLTEAFIPSRFNTLYLIFSFVVLFLFFIMLLQYQFKFCIYFAFNKLSSSDGKTRIKLETNVLQFRKDLFKALQIVFLAFLLTVVSIFLYV